MAKRKLSLKQHEAIRLLRAIGVNQYVLARKFGVHQSTIWSIINKDQPIFERVRRRAVLRKYGVTEEWYYETLAVQNGACKICKRPFAEDEYAHVDHGHDSLEVRGLLCSKCNIGIGQFDDNPWVLRRAAFYLEGKL